MNASRISRIFLAAAFVVTGLAGCASQRAPGDPDTRTTKAIEWNAQRQRLARMEEIENEFLDVEKELGRARARALKHGKRQRATELVKLEARLKQARQDLRDLKVASDGSAERLMVRLESELPDLRRNCRQL